jgi:hypothetical protein
MDNRETLRVNSIKSTGNYTSVKLEDGYKVNLRPYIYVKGGDILEFIPSVEAFEEVNKIITEKGTGLTKKIKIHPPYCKTEIVCVSPHRFTVTFRERYSVKDWKSAIFLEQFHYRGKGLNKLVGRRTVLLVESSSHGIIGYGVLSSTVAAAKPRFELFHTNFEEQMRTKLINQLVRIPRVVIHPEFRGMGLGALTVKHLVQYAKDYWDINGYAPILVEVIASMTDYHRFFESAGFVRSGYTLGYRNGIIPKYGVGSWQPRPNHKQYDFFKNQKGKPYLIYPLNEEIRRMLMARNLIKLQQKRVLSKEILLSKPIHFTQLSAEYKTNNGLTPRGAEIKEAFGVDATQMYSPVLTQFSLRINPGDVVMLTGASGSGKSTIIKLLTRNLDELNTEINISGELPRLDPSKVAKLTANWDEELPLIDQVGGNTKDAIALLNGEGLAEAHLYLKRPSQISDGQRYRFAVARLCDSRKPVWVADEFASSLDPLTAAIVAKGLRKSAWKFGATVVLAAPHIEHFVDSLLPNKIVWLRWGDSAKTFSISCVYEQLEDQLQIQVENTCAYDLTQVTIGGIKQMGEVELLKAIGTLASNCTSNPFQLNWDTVNRFSAIVIRTGEQVGDIVYLAS